MSQKDVILLINFDLKQNLHSLDNGSQTARDGLQSLALEIPPFNSQVALRLGKNLTMVRAHAAIELISIEAAVLRAWFDALNRSEVFNSAQALGKKIEEINKLVQRKYLRKNGRPDPKLVASRTHIIREQIERIAAGLPDRVSPNKAWTEAAFTAFSPAGSPVQGSPASGVPSRDKDNTRSGPPRLSSAPSLRASSPRALTLGLLPDSAYVLKPSLSYLKPATQKQYNP